jgi:retinoid hydroxylase
MWSMALTVRARLALLAVAPWPLIRALGNSSFRRIESRSRRAKMGGGYLGLYSITLAIAIARRPKFARLLTSAAVLGTIAELWVERSSSGRRSRLPTGRLPLIPVGPVTDREFVRKHLERYGPIAKAQTTWGGRPTVCVYGLRRGAAALAEHSVDLTWVGGFDALIPGGFIRSMAQADHAHYKELFRRAFADDVVTACNQHFHEEARRALADLAAEGARDPEKRLDPRPTLGRIVVRSYGRLFLGVLPDTDESALVENLLEEPGPLYAVLGPHDRPFDEYREATEALAGLIRTNAAGMGDQPVGASFLGTLLREDPEALADPNILLNLVMLFAAASRDVTGLLRWIVKLLGENRGWIARVRSDDGDLDTRVVMETLRLAQSEYILRRVVRSFEFDGYVVPRGWWFRVCVNESHRDPSVFPNPDLFDPDRFDRRRYNAAEYAPFGMLEHKCIGVPTTHGLATAFVREFCERDWFTCEDAEPEYDGNHWAPSRRLRIRLRPEDARSVTSDMA